jgi:hypothetical protein
MTIRRLILSVAILCAVAALAAGQSKSGGISPKGAANETVRPAPDSPARIIEEIYAIHAQDLKAEAEDRIINGADRRNLDKYFDKNLANLIWIDLTTQRDEVGVIDFDLFYATQDPQITNVRVAPAQIAGGKASVRVTFNNAGAKYSVVYLLVRENGNWKINDIKYRNGETLLKYFKDAASQQ